LSIDLNELTSAQDIPQSVEISRQLEREGALNGFCMYFKAIFDEEISFSTSPMAEKTHWGSCFFRVENRLCTGQEIIRFKFSIGDFLDIKTWSVSVKEFHEKNVNVLDGTD
jgi:protein arginine N-methyltransferase 1